MRCDHSTRRCVVLRLGWNGGGGGRGSRRLVNATLSFQHRGRWRRCETTVRTPSSAAVEVFISWWLTTARPVSGRLPPQRRGRHPHRSKVPGCSLQQRWEAAHHAFSLVCKGGRMPGHSYQRQLLRPSSNGTIARSDHEPCHTCHPPYHQPRGPSPRPQGERATYYVHGRPAASARAIGSRQQPCASPIPLLRGRT